MSFRLETGILPIISITLRPADSDLVLTKWLKMGQRIVRFLSVGLRNTVYIERAITHLRKARREIPDHVLKHVSPLSWEHINLTGIYTLDAEHQMPEGFRSLRLPARLRNAA